MEAELRKHMLVQRKALLGPDPSDDKHAMILNRLVSYVDDPYGVKSRITMEPDPRHAQILVHELGLSGHGSKAVSTPTEKGASYYDDTPLKGVEEAKSHRSLCMRLGFLAQDAPHLQYVANKCCKHMAVPHDGWFGPAEESREVLER